MVDDAYPSSSLGPAASTTLNPIVSRVVKRCPKPSPQLWDFLAQLVADFESEREFVLSAIDALRIPVEDAHRAAWEKKTRQNEMIGLDEQLKVAGQRLARNQEELMNATRLNEELRKQVPRWEAELEHLRTVTRVRTEGVRYSPGALPEKVATPAQRAGDVACSSLNPPATRAGSSSVGVSGWTMPPSNGTSATSPITVEYRPHDYERGMSSYLTCLEERLKREQDGHAGSKDTLESLQRIDEEEGAALLDTLQGQLERTRKYREHVSAQADDVTRRHIRLQKEHEVICTSVPKELSQLHECNNAASKRLQAKAIHHFTEVEATAVYGKRLEEHTSGNHIAGVLRAREDAAFLEDELAVVQQRGAQTARSLQEQVNALRKKYKGLSEHRSREVVELREDISSLQRAVRQYERLAIRCVDAGLANAGKGAFTPSLVADFRTIDASVDDPLQLADVEALQLRPAVEKLQRVLMHCRAALEGEESQRSHKLSAN